MNADPKQAKAIFLEAVEKHAPDQWPVFLDQACAGQPELRRRVEVLLGAHREAGTAQHDPVDSTDAAERPGAVIGPYKLLQQIGEGGMGTVYLAEQTHPVQRKVALKVIKPGMDSKQVIARFEAERQALAMMDHVNIARVFDGGTTGDSEPRTQRSGVSDSSGPLTPLRCVRGSARPYFVMELVHGVPITKYCDDNHLTPRERLALFVPVCQAIQHAHQKGIIHRDIKPSNVMVTLYDGKPVPKVIDFGVAKATDQKLTERTLFTQYGTMVGTLEYMSPEQAEMSALGVDTRSDIYSLGVLLYELLTGTTPLTRERLKSAAFAEVLRIIKEEEPPKPSTRLSELGRSGEPSRTAGAARLAAPPSSLASVAAQRHTEPAKLTKLVRGELDWIVMKCLEKDRNRRYETVNGFAMDVQRYLADEPVLACPPSTVYRFQKFIRRNKGRVLATVALTLSIVAGVAAVTGVQAKANQERAAAETDRAKREVWATASVASAVREARDRVDEAWAVADYPDRLQFATDAGVAAIRRADDFAAGGPPTEAVLAELAAARGLVDDLARHARLIVAHASNQRRFADELTGENADKARAEICTRHCEALRLFGLDLANGPADEVARVVAASRLRDFLLGMLLQWHSHASDLSAARQEGPDSVPDLPAIDRVVADRLGQVIRSARQKSGGPYARWQGLLDLNDVPGLVAFAATPDVLGFRSALAGALGRDLLRVKQYAASRAYLRAAVDRYPHSIWLHADLVYVCGQMQPPAHAEALRHISAASVQRPDSALFLYQLGVCYADLGSYDHAVAAFRKSIVLSPNSAIAYEGIGSAKLKKKDGEGAIAAFREAVRLRPGEPATHRSLGTALTTTGRHAEALQATLAALRQTPAWAENPRNNLRYNAARAAVNCSDGKGANAPPPGERPGYRKQALDLLIADLVATRKLAAAEREFVHRRMRHWLVDKDLESVRGPKAVGLLPPDERDAWQKLWVDVRELRDQTAPKTDSPK